MNEIPKWMEKYIPAMIHQFFGEDLVGSIEEVSHWDIEAVNKFRDSLSDKSYGFPNRHTFDINMNIKIQLLEIINKEFKLDI